MRILLFILLLTSVAVSSGWAKIYSCRDRSGQLHYSDNLQGLPEVCLGKQTEVKADGADRLNIVPRSPQSSQSSAEFNRSVRAVEREQANAKRQSLRLQQQVEKLIKELQTATLKKHKARRNEIYRSRQIINQANADIARVREQKQQLLQELEDVRLPRREKEQLRSLLEGIDVE